MVWCGILHEFFLFFVLLGPRLVIEMDHGVRLVFVFLPSFGLWLSYFPPTRYIASTASQ